MQFFHIWTSKSGPELVCFVHFDLKTCFSLQRRAIFHFSSNSYLRTRRFTEPTFPPSRPTNHWRNTAFRDFPNISRLLIFFRLTFAQLYLLSSDSTSLLCFFSFWLCYSALLFQLSILSEVRLLNFLRWYRLNRYCMDIQIDLYIYICMYICMHGMHFMYCITCISDTSSKNSKRAGC